MHGLENLNFALFGNVIQGYLSLLFQVYIDVRRTEIGTGVV